MRRMGSDSLDGERLTQARVSSAQANETFSKKEIL